MFFFFLQLFRNGNIILSSWAIKKIDGMLNLAHGLLFAGIKGTGKQRAREMHMEGRAREGVGTAKLPPSGPSGLGLARPHPPPIPYAPAVHNDGAGAAPVALVHLPATRNGHEGQGHQQRGRGAETHTCGPVFLFSPHAQGRGGKRAGQRSRGWRPRTRDGVGGTGLALSLSA